MPQLELSAPSQPEDIRRYLQNSWEKAIAQASSHSHTQAREKMKGNISIKWMLKAQPNFHLILREGPYCSTAQDSFEFYFPQT